MKIGIYGPGDMGRRGLNKHLGDFATDDAKFFFAADDLFGEGTENALRWAMANYDPTDTLVMFPKGDEIEADLEADGIPGEAVEGTLADAFLDAIEVLVVILSDDDEENTGVTEIALAAADRGYDIFDMTHAMAKMEVADDTPEEEAPEPVEPDEDDDPYAKFVDLLTVTRNSAADPVAAEDAVQAILLDKAQRDNVVALAEKMGIAVPPGTWQKTIAADLLEAATRWVADEVTLLSDLYADESAPEPPEAFKEASADVEPDDEPSAAEAPAEPVSAPETAEAPTVTVTATDASELAVRLPGDYVTSTKVEPTTYRSVDYTVDVAQVLVAVKGDTDKAMAFLREVASL